MSSAKIPENPSLFFKCRFSTPYSLTTGDITESNKAMFSALTKVLQKPFLLWAPNCPNTQNVKWSRSIS